MSTALVVQAPKELITFDEQKIALIKNTVCKSLLPLEFEFFISVARARGLDPILRQIHAVKRKDKNGNENMTIQVGIDGFRLIASRTGEYAGCDETEFYYVGDRLERAKIKVYRLVQGQRCAFTATARFDEYLPSGTQGFMWEKMPETMLGKVVEAQALRKAFPADLSGIYSDDEMAGAGPQIDVTGTASEPSSAQPPKTPPKNVNERFGVNPNQKMLSAFSTLGVTEVDIVAKYGIQSSRELLPEQIEELRWAFDQIKAKQFTKAEFFDVPSFESHFPTSTSQPQSRQAVRR